MFGEALYIIHVYLKLGEVQPSIIVSPHIDPGLSLVVYSQFFVLKQFAYFPNYTSAM